MSTFSRQAMLVLVALAGEASAQSLSCPQVSSDTTFDSTAFGMDCDTSTTTGCTSKAGVNFDTATGVLTLPGSAGNFQSPPSRAVSANVYFAAPADYDRDGWTDFVAADNTDEIYVMRNQTITCDTSSCSVNTPATIASSWWETLAHKRPAAFRAITSTGGSDRPLKSGVSASQRMSPMAAGDFDGDGWPDFIQFSATYCPSGCSGNDVKSWVTAARLFLNTQNCHLSSQTSNPAPCGIGMRCSGQPSNGACSGSSVTHGTAFTETQMSCTSSTRCPYYMPTFATYDLRTGAAESDTVSTSSITTTKPGDFGPIGHPVQNIVVLDWDGDGDLDFLFGHSAGTCPSGFCSSGVSTFYAGIDVWLNDCAASSQWNATTKACSGHIPTFSRTVGGCTGSSCNNSDVLIPSTAHNSTSIAPNTNLGFDVSGDGDKRIPGFAYVDIDKDNDYDLVIGSPGCCTGAYQNRLRVFRGTTNSKTSHILDTANPIILSTNRTDSTYAGFKGALTAVFVTDFSGDGFPDIITGSDGFAYSAAGSIGGRTQYWKNTGNATTPFGKAWPTCSSDPSTCAGCSSSCNPGQTTLMSESAGTGGASADLGETPPEFGDFDMGLMLDYDHDPNRTLDMVMTNGNLVNEFYIFPNRASPAQVAACGTVSSGTLDSPTDESTVTGACITPTASFPNSTSSISYYLSNEDPENYIFACKQTSTGTAPASCCVSFTNITGKAIRWKAELDSESSDDTTSDPCSETGSASPSVSAVSANYTYTEASQHYRAGVVVSDGISYVGSFRQPGNRGSFYALAAGDGTKYYDAAAKLDAQSTRNLYTTDHVGTGISRINFSPSSPTTTLIARVGAASATEATHVIDWVLSARFGLGSTLSRLGAVMSSTPAILTPPFRPSWYAFLSATEKAAYDAFAAAQADRVPLAIFGSMDGAVHAVISQATDISDAHNGQEAWGFVPPYVAANMKSDYATSCTPSCSTETLSVTSFPDGAPSLLDYKKSDNSIATVALLTDGAGGSSVTALDVTDTVSSSFAVTGPTPLWSQLPGDALAGKALSKPGVARVRIGGFEKYVVVAGTGINSADPSKGKIVSGYDLETGALLWKFELACALTSDISIFETDDSGEDGAPNIDGYADRAVFGDNCGNLYKINPAADLSGDYMSNAGLGSIALGTSNGVTRFALFSTTQAGALGGTEQRPIVGAIGAKSDATTDMILFFGTGGLESFDPGKVNEFYAVRAKDGSIRNKLTGSCSGSPATCEKFYGGVVITSDTVILQRTVDPVVTGLPGGCDYGSSQVQFLNASTFAQTDLIDEIGGQPIAASSGSLYGDANALYFATVSGEIKRIGAPRATAAGEDTVNGNMNQTAGAGSTSYESPFTLMGWRVVL